MEMINCPQCGLAKPVGTKKCDCGFNFRETELKTDEQEKEETIQKLYNFVVHEMKAGNDKNTIVKKLVGMGMDEGIASNFIDNAHSAISKVAEQEQITSDSLIPAIFGGCIAAIVGGAIWGAIVIVTKYAIGFMAVGVGFLAGYGVVLFARGKRGIVLQIIAVLSSVLGIVVGHYFIFYYYLREGLVKEYGEAIKLGLSMFSVDTVQYFLENIISTMDGYDVLWFVLAIITAWKVPKGLGLKV